MTLRVKPQQDSIAMMGDVLNTAPCGFLSFADDGTIVLTNDTLLRMLGYERDEVEGRRFTTLLSTPGRIFYQTHFFPLLKLHGKADEIYLSLRSRHGDEVPVLVNAVRHERDGVAANDCVLLPMWQRSRYEDEILRAKKEAEAAAAANDEANAALELAYIQLAAKQAELLELNARLTLLTTLDPLTGLQNRSAFETSLATELAFAVRHALPLSLLLLDVDHLKAINDTYGNEVGDQVLQHVGQILHQNARETDIVARYSSEEFALLLLNTDPRGAVEMAERLREHARVSTGLGISVTLSIGAATLARDGATQQTLLTMADQALYLSKQRGPNCVTHRTWPLPAA